MSANETVQKETVQKLHNVRTANFNSQPSLFSTEKYQSPYNMALRARNELSSSTIQSSSLSHTVGLPVFWHDANSNPTMEWDKWVDLFQVAVMAKYSISLAELTRDAS